MSCCFFIFLSYLTNNITVIWLLYVLRCYIISWRWSLWIHGGCCWIVLYLILFLCVHNQYYWYSLVDDCFCSLEWYQKDPSHYVWCSNLSIYPLVFDCHIYLQLEGKIDAFIHMLWFVLMNQYCWWYCLPQLMVPLYILERLIKFLYYCLMKKQAYYLTILSFGYEDA